MIQVPVVCGCQCHAYTTAAQQIKLIKCADRGALARAGPRAGGLERVRHLAPPLGEPQAYQVVAAPEVCQWPRRAYAWGRAARLREFETHTNWNLSTFTRTCTEFHHEIDSN